MATIIKTVDAWRNFYKIDYLSEKSIGFVPTMGALHDGHLSLIKRSSEENDVTVVSIFVNPAQFNDPGDLRNYPRSFEKDNILLDKMKVDYLFYPDDTEIYADNYSYKIVENNLSKILCGAFRPGHFDGVLTVVMKLFNIIRPDKAYFGEKDFQQLELIDGMVKAFFMDIDIIPCPIVRDNNGLALSSRNVLLSENDRRTAINFPELLKSGKSSDDIVSELENIGMKVDYIEEHNGRRFGAVHIGKVRLIDNVQI